MELEILDYLVSFLVGGFICALAQILVVRTNITTARILVLFLIKSKNFLLPSTTLQNKKKAYQKAFFLFVITY